MKKYIFISLIFLITLSSSCNSTTTKNNIQGNSNNNQIVTEKNLNIIPGEEYKLKGLTKVYKSPEVYNSSEVVADIEFRDKVMVKEVKDEYAKVTFMGKEGWVLKWYLTKGKMEIIELSSGPLEKLISNGCYFYATPDEASIKGYELPPETGIYLLAEWNDWYNIELITDDKKYSGDKWIKKNETMDIGDKSNPFQIRSEALKQSLLQTCLQAEKIEMASLATSEAYASIEGDKIQSLVELMKNMKIGPVPNNDGTHVKAELIITKEESIMLADTYIQFLGYRTWMKNRNCLLFEDETTYEKIRELFETYPEFK